MWEDGVLCDVILKVEDKEYPAHRLLLAASSDYFKHLFLNKDFAANDKFEISLRGISSDAVEIILNGLYKGSIDLEERLARNLLINLELLRRTEIVREDVIKKKNRGKEERRREEESNGER